MWKILLLFAVTCVGAFANNTCTLTFNASRATFSSTLASDWTNCGGVKPQAGDNIIISGTGTFTLDTAATFGNGQNPYRPYLASVTGSAGGSSACAGSLPATGGAAYRSGSYSCYISAGQCTPWIIDRGTYTGTPAGAATNISAACTGGSPSYTLNWNPGGGQPAILISNTIKLIFKAAIVARGDVLYVDVYSVNTDAFVFTSGSSLTFDFSVSSAVTPTYNFGAQANGGTWMRGYNTDGSCTRATCSISTTGGGSWRIDNLGSTNGGRVDFEGMTLKNWGDLHTYSYNNTGGTTGPNGFILKNNRVDALSAINIGPSVGNGAILQVDNNWFTNTAFSGFQGGTFVVNASGAWDGTGTREFVGNSFDVQPLASVAVNGMTFTGNVWPGVFNYSRSNAYNAWTRFSDNMVFTAGHDFPWVDAPGGMSNNLFWTFDQFANNLHVGFGGYTVVATQGPYTANVIGVSGQWQGDSGEILIQGSSTNPFQFNYNFILPGANGLSWAEPLGSPHASANQHVTDHNFWYADFGANAPQFGWADLNEVSQTPAGIITSMRCNVMDNPTHANSFQVVQVVGLYSTVSSNVGTPANIDYNYGRGRGTTNASCTGCTNQGNGYVANWTATPGTHDDVVDAPGYDYSRRIETFASQYLHVTATRGAWSTAVSYAKGDTVSDAQSGIYGGASTIWTCIAAAGCGSGTATRPATGVLWSNYWESYAITWAKQQVGAGATFADGALIVNGVGEDTACSAATPCDAITALRHWIMAGYIPTNPRYWGACAMDNKSIGPVEQPATTRMPAAVALN